MTVRPKRPTGVWALLGSPEAAVAEEAQGWTLTWANLMALLAPSQRPPLLSSARVALLQLEVLGSPAAARRALETSEEGGPWRGWLLFQAALAERDGTLLERALTIGAELLADGGPAARALVCADGSHADADTASLPDGPQAELILAAHDRWEPLAERLEREPGVAARLYAAHLRGDRLGQREPEARLVREAAAEAPELCADRALELGARDPLTAAEAIAALARSGTAERAQAAGLLLRALAPERAEPCLPIDDPSQARRAWRELARLCELMAGARTGDREALTRAYREPGDGDLGEGRALRCAELAMAASDYRAAQVALPGQPRGTIARELARRYRRLCLLRAGDGLALASELLDEASPAADEAHSFHLALCTILASSGSAGVAGMLARVGRALPKLPAAALPLIAAELLSALRQHPAEPRGPVWRLLADRFETEDAPAEVRALFGFARGLAALGENDPASAVTAFDASREAGARDLLTTAALAVAEAQRGRFREAVQLLEQLAEELEEAIAVPLLRRAGFLALSQASDLALAQEISVKLLERCPEDAGVIELAASVHLKVGRYGEAAQLLERAAALASDSARAADLLCARGEVLQDRLHNADRAEEAYRHAISVHPLHPRALQALHKLLVTEGRHRELPPILDSLLQLTTTDDERVAIVIELATLHRRLWDAEEQEADYQAALDFCDQALEIDPECEDALRLLVAVCERKKSWAELIARIDPTSTTSLTALRGLATASQEAGLWRELALASQRIAELTPGPHESIAAALLAGDLYRDRLKDLAAAEASYQVACRRHPRESEPLRRVAELLRPLPERAAELAEILERLVALARPDEKLALALELGALLGGLGQARPAIAQFESALAMDPDCVEALEALERLFDDESSLTDLARVLEKRLQLASGAPEELSILLRLGAVFQRQRDERSLLRVATRVHQLFPASSEAFAFAEEVYRAQGRWLDLDQLYERRIQYLDSQTQHERIQEEVVSLLERRALLQEERLDAKNDAASTLARVVGMRPERRDLAERLERILVAAADWQKLLTVFERQANSQRTAEDQIAYLRRAAKVASGQLKDEAEAARLYERIYALDPTDAEGFAFLEKRLERRNDYQRLTKLLLDRASRMPLQDGVSCLLRAAGLSEKNNDVAMAEEIYRRALEAQPATPAALDALARIYESQEDWDRFLQTTRKQIEIEKKASAKALLYFKCGSVLEARYNDSDAAVRCYRSAIKTSPACLPALHSLRDLYSRREDWERVVETLEAEIPLWTDKKGRADVLAQIAEIYSGKLRDPLRSLEFYRRAVETNPENMKAALALFEALASQGNYVDAAAWGEVYARQVEVRGSQAQQAEFFACWGDTLRRIGRYQDAAKYLVWALELRSAQAETLYALLDLCREAPDAYDFAKAFADLLKEIGKRPDRPDEKLGHAILLTGCGVLSEHRGEIDAALELYRRALATGGEQIRLVRPLADLLVLLNQEEEAVELVERCHQGAGAENFSEWLDATIWLIDFELNWRGDYRRAAELCHQALDEQPNRDEIRRRLASALLMTGRPELAQVELQRVCDRLTKQRGDVRVMSERFHALGIAARHADDPAAAESAWRRAQELAPAWPYPAIALARAALARGDAGAAQAELARVAPPGEENADLRRASAELATRQGQHGVAAERYRTLAAAELSPVEDRVGLARSLVLAGQKEQAVATIRATFDASHHLPALAELERAATAAGEQALARRAIQVQCLATGEGLKTKTPPMARGPLRKDLLELLLAELKAHPVDALWRLVVPGIARAFPTQPPPSSVLATPEAQLAATQVGALFDLRLELRGVHNAPVNRCRFARVFANRVLVPPELESLRIGELRIVLLLSLIAARADYAPLLQHPLEEQEQIASALAAVVHEEVVPELQPVIAGLGRREQRALARIVGEVAERRLDRELLARTWLLGLTSTCTRAALILADDIVSLGRVLALHEGVPLALVSSGGLIGCVEELDELVPFFLSRELQQLRSMVTVEDG